MKKIIKGISMLVVIWIVFGTMVFATSNNVTKSTKLINDIEKEVENNSGDTFVKETTSLPENTTENVISEGTTSQLLEMKEKELNTLEDYKEKYGSETYGLAAYVLNRIRIFSIPLCFLGVAISAMYQYVLGIRKLDTRDKGFGIMISIVTIFVICQVLPLVFALVVKGWRG